MTESLKWETMSKAISKCIATFDLSGKILLALSTASGGVSSTSFATVIGTLIGITITFLV